MPKPVPGLNEHKIQSAFMQYVATKYAGTVLDELCYAVPNGGKRDIVTASKLKKEGVKKGILDVHCLIPVNPYHGLLIEFKHGYNKPTPEQNRFMLAATGQKYKCVVCWSLEAGIEALESYLLPRAKELGR